VTTHSPQPGALAPAKPFALYRYFDEGTRLLYIGKSGDLATREAKHIGRSRWMELAASSTIKRYATEIEVRRAEAAAIKAEQPLFNVRYNETTAAWERLRAYLDEIGRPDLLIPKQCPETEAAGLIWPQEATRPVYGPQRGERIAFVAGCRAGRTGIVHGAPEYADEPYSIAFDDGKRHHHLMIEGDPGNVQAIRGARPLAEEDWGRLPWCSPHGDQAQCEICTRIG
jgi:hypothetical protein